MSVCNKHDICQQQALSKAKMICEDNNIKFTILRETVFNIIWESHRPIKAYDLIKKMSNKEQTVKPPIVYRTLDFLLENRLIHKINSINAYTGCTHPLNQHDCFFLICTKCADVQEFCDDSLDKFLQKTIKDNEFHNEHNIIEILGKCKECAISQNNIS